MNKFDITQFSDKNSYQTFMIENTSGLEGKALLQRPLCGRKSTAEAGRAEIADKVSAFIRNGHAFGFIKTEADFDRADKLTARSKIAADPIIHPKLVICSAAVATVPTAAVLGSVDHF